MGRPMAQQLSAAGYEVRGFDVDPAARATLEAQGIATADSVNGVVADAEVVILMLPSSAIVRQVLDQIVRDAGTPDSPMIVDMGSSDPLVTQTLGAELRERGYALIDAPVSGGVSGAQAGTLTIMVGGATGDVERVRSVLTTMGRPTHVGPVGSGHAVKALNNLLSATHLWISSEAVLAGERFGIDPQMFLDVVNSSSGRSGSTEQKWPRFVLPDTFDSGFSLALMVKDMKIATDLCQQLGIGTSLGEEAVKRWSEASTGLPENADHTEIVRWLRTSASHKQPAT